MTAISAAVQFLPNTFNNPITINITGQIRNVSISKNGSMFASRETLRQRRKIFFSQLKKDKLLKGADGKE